MVDQTAIRNDCPWLSSASLDLCRQQQRQEIYSGQPIRFVAGLGVYSTAVIYDKDVHVDYCVGVCLLLETALENEYITFSGSPRRKPAYAGVVHEDFYAAPQAIHSAFLVALKGVHARRNALEVELPNTAAYVGT